MSNTNIKTCKQCQVSKSTTDFHKSSKSKDGLQRLCKICNINKAYDNQKADGFKRLKTNHKKQKICKTRTINRIKSNYGCFVCSEKEGFCLDFHHIRNKKECVSRLLSSRRFQEMVEEICKCIILCSNCHRKYHNNIIQIDEKPELCKITLEEWEEEFNKTKKELDTFDVKSFDEYLQGHSLIETAQKYKVQVNTIYKWIKKYNLEKPTYFANNRKKYAPERKTKRPTKDILEKLIWELPKTKIGKQFGVSDNAVEKWIKYYNLEKPPTGYFIRKGTLA